MNRRSFFKFLGIGASAVAVAPKIMAVEQWFTFNKPLKGNLTVFETPRKGYDYSIGVEEGFEESCFSIMRIGKSNEPCVQVAEYMAHRIYPTEFTYDIARVTKEYGVVCNDPRGPLLVIEQVSAPGDITQNQLKIMGFTRFFKVAGNTKDKNGKSVPWNRDGWYTTKFSGPIMIGRFKEAVRNGWYKPKSVKLTRYDSMRVPNNELRSNACFMAAAQSYVGYHAFYEDKRNV
jgi:hypothetical protein